MRIVKGKKGLTALEYSIDKKDLAVWEKGDEFSPDEDVMDIKEKRPTKSVTTKQAERRKRFMKRSSSIPKKLQSVKKRRNLLEKKYRVRRATTLRRKKLGESSREKKLHSIEKRRKKLALANKRKSTNQYILFIKEQNRMIKKQERVNAEAALELEELSKRVDKLEKLFLLLGGSLDTKATPRMRFRRSKN